MTRPISKVPRVDGKPVRVGLRQEPTAARSRARHWRNKEVKFYGTVSMAEHEPAQRQAKKSRRAKAASEHDHVQGSGKERQAATATTRRRVLPRRARRRLAAVVGRRGQEAPGRRPKKHAEPEADDVPRAKKGPAAPRVLFHEQVRARSPRSSEIKNVNAIAQSRRSCSTSTWAHLEGRKLPPPSRRQVPRTRS